MKIVDSTAIGFTWSPSLKSVSKPMRGMVVRHIGAMARYDRVDNFIRHGIDDVNSSTARTVYTGHIQPRLVGGKGHPKRLGCTGDYRLDQRSVGEVYDMNEVV